MNKNNGLKVFLIVWLGQLISSIGSGLISKAYTKEELYSVHRFYIEDEGMLEAATDAFKEKGIYCTIEENNGEKYLEIIWEG